MAETGLRDEDVMGMTDDDVFKAPEVDLSPPALLKVMFDRMAEDVGKSQSYEVSTALHDVLERLESAVDDITSKNEAMMQRLVDNAVRKIEKTHGDRSEATVKDVTFNISKIRAAVTEAVKEIKMPDLSQLRDSLAQALKSIEKSSSESNAKIAEALHAVAKSKGSSEVRLPDAAPKKEDSNWSFKVYRDTHGNIDEITATPTKHAKPRTAMEAVEGLRLKKEG